jgi:hypothetical protein
MTNFEKYNKLHDEVLKRLEDGEITVETAKEVTDLAFDKYITEDSNSSNNKFINNIKQKVLSALNRAQKEKSMTINADQKDSINKRISAFTELYKWIEQQGDQLTKQNYDKTTRSIEKKYNIKLITIEPTKDHNYNDDAKRYKQELTTIVNKSKDNIKIIQNSLKKFSEDKSITNLFIIS